MQFGSLLVLSKLPSTHVVTMHTVHMLYQTGDLHLPSRHSVGRKPVIERWLASVLEKLFHRTRKMKMTPHNASS